MSFNANSGYDGFSMSKRAKEAYDNGEKPKSKWTKKLMLDRIEEELEYLDDETDLDIEDFKQLSKDKIFNSFFIKTGWHHTSKYFNETYFYGLDDDLIVELRKEDLIEFKNKDYDDIHLLLYF